jgi:hypothetical protein
MTRPPRSVEPRLVAVNGPIASTLRQAMFVRGWQVAHVNERLGLKRDSTRLYAYLRAETAPPPEIRAKLAALFEVSEEALMPAPGPQTELPLTVRPPSSRAMPPAPATIAVQAGGKVRLVVDQMVTLRVASQILALLG